MMTREAGLGLGQGWGVTLMGHYRIHLGGVAVHGPLHRIFDEAEAREKHGKLVGLPARGLGHSRAKIWACWWRGDAVSVLGHSMLTPCRTATANLPAYKSFTGLASY